MRPRRHGSVRWIVCLLVCAPALLACARSEPVARYATRGLVIAVVGAGEDLRVALHHEPIPHFKDREGELSPMPSMTMLFALARGLSRSELAPNVKLELDFEVHWRTSPTLVITQLKRLPDDTALALSHDH